MQAARRKWLCRFVGLGFISESMQGTNSELGVFLSAILCCLHVYHLRTSRHDCADVSLVDCACRLTQKRLVSQGVRRLLQHLQRWLAASLQPRLKTGNEPASPRLLSSSPDLPQLPSPLISTGTFADVFSCLSSFRHPPSPAHVATCGHASKPVPCPLPPPGRTAAAPEGWL